MVKKHYPTFSREIAKDLPLLEAEKARVYEQESLEKRVESLGYTYASLYKQLCTQIRSDDIAAYHEMVRAAVFADLLASKDMRKKMIALIVKLQKVPLEARALRQIPPRIREIHQIFNFNPEMVENADLSSLLSWYLSATPPATHHSLEINRTEPLSRTQLVEEITTLSCQKAPTDPRTSQTMPWGILDLFTRFVSNPDGVSNRDLQAIHCWLTKHSMTPEQQELFATDLGILPPLPKSPRRVEREETKEDPAPNKPAPLALPPHMTPIASTPCSPSSHDSDGGG